MSGISSSTSPNKLGLLLKSRTKILPIENTEKQARSKLKTMLKWFSMILTVTKELILVVQY